MLNRRLRRCLGWPENVVVHYRASGRELPQQSRSDVDLRWIEAILATDQRRHHDAPLDSERPVEARVQGCCRDHSLLAVAALRVVIRTTCLPGLSGSGPMTQISFWSVSDGSFTVVTGFALRTSAVRMSATV